MWTGIMLMIPTHPVLKAEFNSNQFEFCWLFKGLRYLSLNGFKLFGHIGLKFDKITLKLFAFNKLDYIEIILNTMLFITWCLKESI